MTIALLLSESIPKEIKNILKSLDINQKCRYKGLSGYIAFISDDYISMCYQHDTVKNYKRQHPHEECCLLIYCKDWEDIEIEDEHFYDVKNYRGKTNDHPGNEMLPDVTVR